MVEIVDVSVVDDGVVGASVIVGGVVGASVIGGGVVGAPVIGGDVADDSVVVVVLKFVVIGNSVGVVVTIPVPFITVGAAVVGDSGTVTGMSAKEKNKLKLELNFL
jgi:hypothetical protein